MAASGAAALISMKVRDADGCPYDQRGESNPEPGLKKHVGLVVSGTDNQCCHFWQEGYFKEGKWCCQTGLNCRPLHYQWSALPLSYGSMPRIQESAQRAPTERADPCHKAPFRASAGGGRNPWKTVPFSAPRRPVSVRSLRVDPVPGAVACGRACKGAYFGRHFADLFSRRCGFRSAKRTGSRCRTMMARATGDRMLLRKIRARARAEIGGKTG